MKSVVLAAVVASMSTLANAAVITQWNFNSVPGDANTGTGTTVPVIGAGTISLVGGTTSTFASGDASGGSSDPQVGDDSGLNVSTFPAQGANNKTAGIQVAVSTVGLQDITFGFDLRHSNTSSRFEQVQYSIDGVNFIDIASFSLTTGDTWANGRLVDLSSVAGVANNANFAVRVVSAFDPAGSGYVATTGTATYGPTGTWRFDMVTVSGTVIPEPSALGLLAPAGLLLARRRK